MTSIRSWIASWSPNRSRQFWYAPILAMAMGLMMMRMLILARLLSLSEFAQFSEAVLVSSSFCMLRCLGLLSLLQRQWPVNLMHGQRRRPLMLAAQCNLVALFSALIVSIISVAIPSFTAVAPAMLVLGIVHGFSQQTFLTATVESRSCGDSLRYARDNIIRAVSVLVFGCTLAWLTRSACAALIAEALLSIILASLLFRESVVRTGMRVFQIYTCAYRQLRNVKWNSVLVLFSIGVIGFAVANVDRWVAVETFDHRLFGVYSFAWIVLMISQSAQTIMNASAYPLLARRFAIGGRKGAFRVCVILSFGVLITVTMGMVPGWFFLDWAVHRWFREYSMATAILPLFFVVALIRISDFWSSYLVIVGQERQLLKINVGIVFVGSAVWVIVSRPWLGALSLQDVAFLAVIYAVLSYLATAILAWHSRA